MRGYFMRLCAYAAARRCLWRHAAVRHADGIVVGAMILFSRAEAGAQRLPLLLFYGLFAAMPLMLRHCHACASFTCFTLLRAIIRRCYASARERDSGAARAALYGD